MCKTRALYSARTVLTKQRYSVVSQKGGIDDAEATQLRAIGLQTGVETVLLSPLRSLVTRLCVTPPASIASTASVQAECSVSTCNFCYYRLMRT
jgi:hypothetical protein